MFRKKINIDEMSSEEMEAFLAKALKRIVWLNALWLLFVVVVLFWHTTIGVILLIITGVKYLFDYYDVDSQAHDHNFVHKILKKKLIGK